MSTHDTKQYFHHLVASKSHEVGQIFESKSGVFVVVALDERIVTIKWIKHPLIRHMLPIEHGLGGSFATGIVLCKLKSMDSL